MDLSHKNLTELPQNITDEIEGLFSCSNNELTSLVGSLKKVLKTFYCGHNKFLNLSGAPTEVLGDFDCEFNNLTSLYDALR